MTIRSISFDDSSDEDLSIFSGNDLLISHYDQVDLDWQEVAERTALDERRGLVVLQVATLEDLIDDFLLYLGDESDQDAHRRRLEYKTFGPRLDELQQLLLSAGLLDERAQELVTMLRGLVGRRNELAHGTISVRLCSPGRLPLAGKVIDVEWVLTDRRSRTTQRITMSELRKDVYDAIGAFSAALSYAEYFVEVAPWPKYFRGGPYLVPPSS